MTTVTDHLLRSHAPIPTKAWQAIDDEAKERLSSLLVARQVADWNGPGGWAHDAHSLGRTDRLSALPPGMTVDGAEARQRRVLPLAEITVPFTVSRAEIDDIQRGALDPDFDDLDRAAREAALIETRAVFHGWPAAGIVGITEASSYPSVELGADCSRYPTVVAVAVDKLRRNGIEGPYDLVISPDGYTRIVETAEEGGYLLLDHLATILGGSVIWAPGVDGAVLVRRAEGDFIIDAGQDMSIGYRHHDADTVYLYLEESFTFRVVEPDAALVLT